MFSPKCLLYLVIQDFVQKVLFFEVQAIRTGRVNMFNERGDINTVLNHCKSVLYMQNFTETDKMLSKVITKHVCNYRNSFCKKFYRIILTTFFF